MQRDAERRPFDGSGAGNEARTRDLNLGKVALYQLSYSRVEDRARDCKCDCREVKAKNDSWLAKKRA